MLTGISSVHKTRERNHSVMKPIQIRLLYGTHRNNTAMLRPGKAQNNGVIRGDDEKPTSVIPRAGDVLEKERISNYQDPPATVPGELASIEPQHINHPHNHRNEYSR